MNETPHALPDFETLIAAGHVPSGAIELGRSRQGRPVVGYRFGDGPFKISLIGGCHADEPVGPRLLARVAAFLSQAPGGSEVLERFAWWIVPHLNPDGAAQNQIWYDGVEDAYDLSEYLRYVVRESPGDDIEFGFPRDANDSGARPENRAVFDWWRSDDKPFGIHVSLHGMAFAGGPWFLIEPAWQDRCERLQNGCRDAVARLGYPLHDVQRNGEKGFTRIARGFCTRPSSRAMSQYFIERGDKTTAGLFRPSSMETIRSLGRDALTLVSEMPLFVVRGVGDTIEPADPVADRWREQLMTWRVELQRGDVPVGLDERLSEHDVRPMPIDDQMRLQWELIRAGIEQVLAVEGQQ